MNNDIHICLGEIPPEVGDSFGRVVLAGFKNFISDPENLKKLEAQMVIDQQRKKTKSTSPSPNDNFQ